MSRRGPNPPEGTGKAGSALWRAVLAEYDSPEYRRIRANLKREVEAGNGWCWRCGKWLPPGSKWHTGHSDDRTTVMGGECVSCNLGTAASKGARVANANRKARKAGLLPPAPLPPAQPRICKPHVAEGVTKCGGIHSRPW